MTMPIVSAKCTCCGAEIKVDDQKEALVCEHCNSAFIVEKAIELYNSEKETVEFEVIDGVLKKYNGDAEDVVIPDRITRIGGGAFIRNTVIKSVFIPKSVREIGDYAFAYCTSLSKVTCPDNEDTENCVVFSEDLEYFGDHCFRGCSSLPPIIMFLNKNRIYHDGDPIFRHCYDEAESVIVIQKDHHTPHLYSKVGAFDMELTPLSSHLFGLDFDKSKVRYKSVGKDEKESAKEKEQQTYLYNKETEKKSEEHRVHRSDIWKKNGLCAHCGGSFNLLRKCKSCGMKKDY